MSFGQIDIAENDIFDISSIAIIDVSENFGGNSGNNFTVGNDHSWRHDSSSRDDARFAYDGLVEDSGSDSDEAPSADSSAVDAGVVSDDDVIFNREGNFIFAVEHGEVLNANTFANSDGSDISSSAGERPKAGLLADGHIADNHGAFGQKNSAMLDHSSAKPRRTSIKLKILQLTNSCKIEAYTFIILIVYVRNQKINPSTVSVHNQTQTLQANQANEDDMIGQENENSGFLAGE